MATYDDREIVVEIASIRAIAKKYRPQGHAGGAAEALSAASRLRVSATEQREDSP